MLAVLWISDGVPSQCICTSLVHKSDHDWNNARGLFLKKISDYGLDKKYPEKMAELNEEMREEFEFDGFEFSSNDSLWIIE